MRIGINTTGVVKKIETIVKNNIHIQNELN